MLRGFLLPVLAAVLTVLSGCSRSDEVPAGPEVSHIDILIAEAVEVSARSNRAVAEVEVAVAAPQRAAPGQTTPPGVVLPPEVEQLVTIDWQGRVEPMLEALAVRAGYAFRVTGRAPATPVLISVVASDEPLVDVLRKAGNLVHDVADVVLDPSLRRIELRYGGR